VNDEFETAVVGTLADLAKVDRSTTEQVRASIALLPDRRSSRLSRIGRSISISPARRRPFAVAAALVIVVAVAGFSLLGRFQAQPVGPASPTPSTPSVASPSSPSITATPPPSARPTPTSTDRQPQAFPETLPVVYTGESLYVEGWAPDGSKFAVLDQPRGSASAPSIPKVHLFDRIGAEIGSVEASEFGWLDSSRFVILRFEVSADPSQTVQGEHAYLGRIGSTQLTALGTYDWIVAGPSGAVALIQPWDWTTTLEPQYVVVSADGGLSAPRSGYPVAWSRDGSMLAVVHITGPAGPSGVGSRPYGWLEVVRSTGESVASARQVESDFTGPVAFSPDGARVAVFEGANLATKDQKIGVLETASGRLTTIPKSGAFTWASNDELLFAYMALANDSASPTDRILAWSASSGQLADYGPGNLVGASGGGTVVTGFGGTPSLAWTTRSGGKTASGTLSLGDGPWMGIPDAAWSPDGSSLVLIAGDGMVANMDALLFQP
jgi:hypothetical protein